MAIALGILSLGAELERSSGRPQPGWEEGIALAKSVVQARSISQKGSNALRVGTRIREALFSIRSAVQETHTTLQLVS